MPKILFTGGGSAGHVTPNLALITYFQAQAWETIYIGSKIGIEKELIAPTQIPYHAITCDKFRRHFSFKTLLSPLKIALGIAQAFALCRRIKPDVVFSKGGYVAFPVVFAAWLCGIPVVAHESDLTPGLANKLSLPFAKQICVTFPEGVKYFKNKYKVTVSGTPIRASIKQGDANKGLSFCAFNKEKPIILVYGGGLGSVIINDAIRKLLPTLLKDFQIVHLCGKNKVEPSLTHTLGYKQFEYVHAELGDLYACATLVISRAGANSIYELLSLNKPHILIPLSKKASRGDQIVNAHYFARQGTSYVVTEAELTETKLQHRIKEVYSKQEEIKANITHYALPDSIKLIYGIINEVIHHQANATITPPPM